MCSTYWFVYFSQKNAQKLHKKIVPSTIIHALHSSFSMKMLFVVYKLERAG